MSSWLLERMEGALSAVIVLSFFSMSSTGGFASSDIELAPDTAVSGVGVTTILKGCSVRWTMSGVCKGKAGLGNRA